jgi:hypothetical protein
VFRELDDATAAADRPSVRAGMRAARRGEAAADVASARVAVARAREIRAEAGGEEREHEGRPGWRIAYAGLGALWLLLALTGDGGGERAWRIAMGIGFLGSAVPDPARRYARARRAEALNRAALRGAGVPYEGGAGPAYVAVPLGSQVTGTAAVAAVFAVGCWVVWAIDDASVPDPWVLAVGAAAGLAFASLLAWSRARRTATRESPPPWEG